MIADGRVRLRVERVTSGRAECSVRAGGVVRSHKGVNVPGVPVPIPSLTRKDLDDLEFALALDVDFVALSFVRSAADVRDLKDLIQQAGATANVIAKIEKAEAVDALDAILEDADAVMVARRVRSRGDASGSRDPRPNVQRAHRLCGGAPAAAAAGTRSDAPRVCVAADGDRVGSDSAANSRVRRRRGALGTFGRCRP